MEIPCKVKPKMFDAHVSQKRKFPKHQIIDGHKVVTMEWHYLVNFPTGNAQWMPASLLEFTTQDRKQLKWLHYWKGK